MDIRTYTDADADALWAILEPILREGETYTLARDVSRAEALGYWTRAGNSVFMAEVGGVVLGTYFLCANQGGGGAHVCNCGFATAKAARGKGIARGMLDHALTEATRQGFRAMQFNFVIATNTRAVAIWESHGFETVGRLPGAFEHPREGFVDALVMYRALP